MTLPPLPESNVVRVEMIQEPPNANQAGSRFFLGYTGSAPSSANCVTLAGDVESAWVTNLAPLVPSNWSLNKVDVLDISTRLGAFGESVVTHDGTRAGAEVPQQVATGIEYKVAVRYRGGKPRIYQPPGLAADVVNDVSWAGAFVTDYNAGIAAFFAELAGLSIGAMGVLSHVVVSYYHGFSVSINPVTGRSRNIPTYRTPNALVWPVTGYDTKSLLSSQKRRRTSTTP
jgi:hypothetical protein